MCVCVCVCVCVCESISWERGHFEGKKANFRGNLSNPRREDCPLRDKFVYLLSEGKVGLRDVIGEAAGPYSDKGKTLKGLTFSVRLPSDSQPQSWKRKKSWKRLKGKNPEGKSIRKLPRRKQSSAKILNI